MCSKKNYEYSLKCIMLMCVIFSISVYRVCVCVIESENKKLLLSEKMNFISLVTLIRLSS